MQAGINSYLKGITSFLPGSGRLFCSSSGGTVSARYCYSVWMRHLIHAYDAGMRMKLKRIAELGPGDSFGIGICGVLCGVNEYYALDAKEHACTKRNMAVFAELVELFKERASIPDGSEFPNLSPVLNDYSFPHNILSDDALRGTLHENRLNAIRAALIAATAIGGINISYIAPWESGKICPIDGGLDMVFSQAVMEHVDDIHSTYSSLYHWLRPGGYMSHTIDYKSHGYTRDWNGHWTVPEYKWRIIRGNRPYFINRLPHSVHISSIQRAGFRVVKEVKVQKSTNCGQSLADEFRDMGRTDQSTSGAFIIAERP